MFWSKHIHQDLEREFREAICQDQFADISPVVEPLSLNKQECKSGGNFDISKISKLLEEQLKKVPSYNLFTQWEGVINRKISAFIGDIFATSDQAQIFKILHALAEAYAGKDHRSDIPRYALLTLNSALKSAIG